MKRRNFLALSTAFIGSCAGKFDYSFLPKTNDTDLLNDIQKRTFDFFWETTDHKTGLTPDRWPNINFSSIAGIGFALSVYPIGVKNNYITRDQAKERTLNTLRFLWGLKQGPEPRGNSGYKGFYYHFLDFEKGERIAECELSTVDTALLMAGVLFAADYFDKDDAQEAEIRKIAKNMNDRIDWQWARGGYERVTMGWHPEHGFIDNFWFGYTEAMLVYVLALGSPTYPINPKSWIEWTETYKDCWGSYGGYEHLIFPPHFGHQYSHSWIDFKGIFDAYMKEKGFDYFENSRRATYAQQAYAINNPQGWRGYSKNIWGITACDGPLNIELEFNGKKHKFITYAGRGAAIRGNENTYDDGTIAPTAAVSSIPYAPEISIECTKAMHEKYGKYIYGKYGFIDSFNQSFDFDIKPQQGKIIKGFGWVNDDYLAIDQGPIVMAIENYRTGFIWEYMRNNPIIRRGLIRAGFTGGYLEAK